MKDSRPITGTTISHYRILQPLGAGGMGEVYLAEDTRLNRKVAIKFLPSNSTSDQQAKKRLVREARAAATLDHTNICSVYEVGEEDGRGFIVMQYVEGETLAARIQRKPLDLRESLDIAVQVADALAEAHRHGIIHRDIKPQNIMITDRRQVKLMDFGLAKVVRERSLTDTTAETESLLTEPGAIIGTVPYMSPEQVRGENLDARSDIFSFGAVLYEMITGHQPFAAESAAMTISAIVTREPAPLARYAKAVPRQLERIVNKALRKYREERYQTARDLLIDLKNLKHELEFEAELERSRSSEADGAAFATTSERVTAPNAGAAGTLSGRAQTIPGSGSLTAGITRNRVTIAVAGLVIAAAGLAYLLYSARTAGAIDSIAVLPLANASDDPNTEYLSDGISEALINSLTELQQLRVVARSTAFRYKGKEVDPQSVGRELKVRAVLMGRVRQAGDALNIQVDLVDANTGAQLWGKEYERKISDVLSVKQAVVREVTEKLRLRLSGEEQRQLVRHDATNAEAYQFYLRGRYYWNKRTADGMRKAIEQFQQAIDRDPDYALGYAGLADCYSLMEYYAGVSESETLPKARAAADHALQIDDSLAEAHTSLAAIYQKLWRWSEAEEEYKRALNLNPNYPTAHQWFAGYLRVRRQFDASLSEIKRAQQLDPLSPIISAQVAEVYLLKNDPSSAIEQCKKVIDLEPSFGEPHDQLGFAYFRQRRYEEAATEFQKAVELSGRASFYLSDLGYCYAVTGRRAEALAILKELLEKHTKHEANGRNLASVYAGLGDKNQVFAWLEDDFRQHSSDLQWFPLSLSFEDLRGDPRYADLVRRMGLSQ